MAFYLLFEAGRFHEWQLAGEGAPDSTPVAFASIAVAGLTLLAWFGYVRFVVLQDHPQLRLLHPADVFFANSRSLVPGILISMMFPAAAAVFRFVMISLSVRSLQQGSGSLGLAGAIVSLINLAASIATLVIARDYFFPAVK